MDPRVHRDRRWLRWTAWIVVGVLVLAAAGLLAGGWHFSGQLVALPEVRPFSPDTEVLAVSTNEVSLPAEGDAAIDGAWGLQLPDDRHVVLGAIAERQGDVVTRTFDEPTGAPPRRGEPARVDEYVWTGDPARALGIAHREVEVDAELGTLPTWLVPGTSDTWVVFVHGRGGTREEALRFLPLLTELGHPVLVPSYRGDGVAPDPPDGTIAFGLTEWRDLEAVVGHALDEGATDVVLMGASMGGATVATFVRESPLASVVAGVVLDSPVLSMDALLELQADLEGIPAPLAPPLLAVTEVLARLRSDLDTRRLEFVGSAEEIDVPVLLVHGADDTFVPVEPSDRFARAHPDTTYLRVDRADHVRSWNVDRGAYEAALRTFLAEVAG